MLIDALIVSGSFCTVVGVLVIGHSLSGNLRKSGPACQLLLISMPIGFVRGEFANIRNHKKPTVSS